mmetsp:Transcript_10844/g.15993  ORF Transcript_10844/g.15993 Transcript_10844/m.15993 type:complete len:89 (+) Transcript_10844:292-558(+)
MYIYILPNDEKKIRTPSYMPCIIHLASLSVVYTNGVCILTWKEGKQRCVRVVVWDIYMCGFKKKDIFCFCRIYIYQLGFVVFLYVFEC